MKHIKIICPDCKTILLIDRVTEKIVEMRKPILEQSTGDRFKDAFIKSKQDKLNAERKFKESTKAYEKRSESLQDIFNKSLKRVKENDDKSKPETPFDFE